MEKKIFVSQHSCNSMLKRAFVANKADKKHSFADQLRGKKRKSWGRYWTLNSFLIETCLSFTCKIVNYMYTTTLDSNRVWITNELERIVWLNENNTIYSFPYQVLSDPRGLQASCSYQRSFHHSSVRGEKTGSYWSCTFT